MPTGIAMRDARDQLFEAAERVLLRDGPSALTSRAVTAEAGVAKGVLHRHFADFDTFLAELVLDRIARLERRAAALNQSAGTGAVLDNLTGALVDVFGPVAMAMVGLVTSRHALLDRLRATTPKGIPLLTEATEMVAAYLAAERELGRVSDDADIAMLAATLIGAGHLRFAGRREPPAEAEVYALARSVVVVALMVP